MVDGANGLLSFFITLISDVLSNVGVPLFFLFSGFLFFYQSSEFNRNLYLNKIRKRAKTLLLPYLIWNTIALIFALCRFFPVFSRFLPNLDDQSIQWSFSGFFNSYWNMDNSILRHDYMLGENIYPIDQPLWYVRDLMIIILCTPLIYYMIKNLRYYWVVLLGIIWLIIEPIKLGHINQLMTALMFFSWGASYSIQKVNFVTRYRKYKLLPLLYIAVAVIDVFIKEYEVHIYIHDIGIIIGIVSFVYVASLIVEKKTFNVSTFLAGASFFVYAGHDIILNNFSKVLTRIWHINSQWYLLANYIIVPIIIVVVFLCLYGLIRKYSLRLLVPFTGGR